MELKSNFDHFDPQSLSTYEKAAYKEYNSLVGHEVHSFTHVCFRSVCHIYALGKLFYINSIINISP